MTREMYRDVTHLETAEVSERAFYNTFTRHLMLAIGETSRRNERVDARHEK